ncbi:hypothetical protein [Jatrophihabitans sp.]|uniref:hypothetical protein n=1 Tax=Jatrophihabitans sp. TaxID=1932789 RepID=UPI002BA3D1F8|nr:hypothetical protein [Jatrophihabitans sp.]
MTVPKRKTIWVQQVAVDANSLQIRLDVARAAGTLTPQDEAVANGVQSFIEAARNAADRKDPVPSRVINWWRGVLVEAAYRNLHAARAQLIDLYSEADLDAEIPGAVARTQTTLHRDDPRCLTQRQLRDLPIAERRAWLRRLTEVCYEAVDLKHARLRSFRNNLFMAAVVVIALVAITVLFVSQFPSAMPLCFDNVAADGTRSTSCPTRSNTSVASGGDILLVSLIGLLGGTLATTVAIRNIRGTSIPYDVPVALAWLKVPLGAFTAILGLVAIHGGFIPGLSALDSQEQIIAYALLLGFAQQAFTGVLDRRAQSLLTDTPSKESQTAPQVASAHA